MTTRTALRILAGSVALLALAACDRDATTQARRDAEAAGKKVDQALDRTQQKLAELGKKTQQQLAEVGDKMAAGVKDAATPDGQPRATAGATTTTSSNGSTTTTTVTTGPRTSVTGVPAIKRSSLGDAGITASIKTDFLKDPDLSVLKIDVDTRDGVVTLNGLAENEAARKRAEQLAGAIKGVREVRNYLTVKRS